MTSRRPPLAHTSDTSPAGHARRKALAALDAPPKPPPSGDALDELQAEVADRIATTERVIEALRNAEGCETGADYVANIAEAIVETANLTRELRALDPR
jgi:hypothetical protein